MRLIIVSVFWNAEKYIEKCIKSVMEQSHRDFLMYLIDDISDDKTVQIIKSLIHDDPRFRLIVNVEKKFKLRNMDDLIRDQKMMNDADVIIELDGDDRLYSSSVLETIFKKYSSNSDLWITNGSFVYSVGGIGISAKANPLTVRHDPFVFSHLRTWKVFLWRAVKGESFRDFEGNFYRSAGDLAYSFPMLELAGKNHYEYIPDVLYEYNMESPFNEHQPGSACGGAPSQSANDSLIRRCRPYRPLHFGGGSEYQSHFEISYRALVWQIKFFTVRLRKRVARVFEV